MVVEKSYQEDKTHSVAPVLVNTRVEEIMYEKHVRQIIDTGLRDHWGGCRTARLMAANPFNL